MHCIYHPVSLTRNSRFSNYAHNISETGRTRLKLIGSHQKLEKDEFGNRGSSDEESSPGLSVAKTFLSPRINIIIP
ncbi:unnamed protein product [Clavelina lepadiformis]|uniref:Uncharacterized protein n=1 Tax=Clavelina lepadiformis TaxID=159417 RepID=A0ABP0FFI2_CLALP